jgi:hypothetical protein
MKASRGCENLKAPVVGEAGPASYCCSVREKRYRVQNLKGDAASWCASWLAYRVSGELEIQGQQLGAWVSSEEDPKPKRGTRETNTCFLGGLECEYPEVRLARVKDMRGASKQWRR